MSDGIDYIKGVFDGAKERTRNPFFFTLAVVWIVRNWDFCYSLFHFADETSLKERLFIIHCYFQGYPFWRALGTAAIALGVVLLTYVFLAVAKIFAEFYKEKFTLIVLQKLKSKRVVLKTELDSMEGDRDKYRKLYEDVRAAKISEGSAAESNEGKLNSQLESTRQELESTRQELESLRNNDPLGDNLKKGDVRSSSELDSDQDFSLERLSRFWGVLKRKELTSHFIMAVRDSRKGEYMDSSEQLDSLIAMSLLRLLDKQHDRIRCKVTELGGALYEYMLLAE